MNEIILHQTSSKGLVVFDANGQELAWKLSPELHDHFVKGFRCRGKLATAFFAGGDIELCVKAILTT